MEPDHWHRVLIEACDALADLVREEFPDGYSLADIYDTWGPYPTSVDALNAIRFYEAVSRDVKALVSE